MIVWLTNPTSQWSKLSFPFSVSIFFFVLFSTWCSASCSIHVRMHIWYFTCVCLWKPRRCVKKDFDLVEHLSWEWRLSLMIRDVFDFLRTRKKSDPAWEEIQVNPSWLERGWKFDFPIGQICLITSYKNDPPDLIWRRTDCWSRYKSLATVRTCIRCCATRNVNTTQIHKYTKTHHCIYMYLYT